MSVKALERKFMTLAAGVVSQAAAAKYMAHVKAIEQASRYRRNPGSITEIES